MDNTETLTINSFRGGIVEQGRLGPRGAFQYGQGLDIRSGEDSLKCQQSLKKDSGSVVTDLPLAIFPSSDGAIYAFGDTGKIYRKSGGTWTLKYTDGDGKITGAIEYVSTAESWILYATQTKLKKITLTNAGGTWSGNITTVGTFTNGLSGNLHTMWEALGVIFILDGDTVALYDYQDVANFSALLLPTGTQATTIKDRGSSTDRVVIGSGSVLGKGNIFQWDRLADSWFGKKDSQGRVINAMEWLEGGLLAQVGGNGQMKYWNLNEFYPFKRIPGTDTSNPGSSCIHNSIVHIGMNGGTKNGVYTVGRFDKNDSISLNLEYIPSHGKLTGTEIGAVNSDGETLYVGWKDGSTYGIDIIDTENKAPAVYESMLLNMSKGQMDKLVEVIKIETISLPAGCSYAVKWRSSVLTGNEVDTWNVLDLRNGSDFDQDVDGSTGGAFKCGGQGETFEVRIDLTPNGNLTPEIRSINLYFDFLNGI